MSLYAAPEKKRPDYRLADGTKPPSVTTVLGRFKESGGLIHWAWSLGMEGKDYKAEQMKAANAGTLAHSMVEAHIRGTAFPQTENWPPDIYAKAWNAFENFKKWAKQSSLNPVATEVSLVSEKYGFAGTLDAMLVDGELSLGDWKTSNAVYSDYLLQLAAYGVLWEENNPDQPIKGGFHLLRFAKNEPDFSHHFYGDLSNERDQFLDYVRCFKRDKQIAKRVR